MIEKLYTVEEVAELASVTGRTIRNYLKSGRLIGRKIGGQWRFPEAEVQRLLTGADFPLPADDAEPQIPAPSAADYESHRASSGEHLLEPPQHVQAPLSHSAVQPAAAASPKTSPIPAHSEKPAESAALLHETPLPPVQTAPGRPTASAETPNAPAAASLPAFPSWEESEKPSPVQFSQTYYVPPAPLPAPVQQLQRQTPSAAPPPSPYSVQTMPETIKPAPSGAFYPSSPEFSANAQFPQPYPYMNAALQGMPSGAVPMPPYTIPAVQPQPGMPQQQVTPQQAVMPPQPAVQTAPVLSPGGYYVPASLQTAPSAQIPPSPQPAAPPSPQPPAAPEKTHTDEDAKLHSRLSDVGIRVTKFLAEVHDCSHGPIMCSIVDLHQNLSAAKSTSATLNLIADEESADNQPCQCFVEYDDRFFVARYTLFGTTAFLLRCLKLIG